ncbi:MAG: hypothetical protein KKC85_11600 [Gammaproteobacteria bacterium]|nr:hypothetical protein [Gammaproteobacteria bacterium]MBU1441587.1 hypothetical protein [Gammaproteobacteria bacterium]MBU2287069.1 hypothetical protein [Gammaproteobacteria bacterium]
MATLDYFHATPLADLRHHSNSSLTGNVRVVPVSRVDIEHVVASFSIHAHLRSRSTPAHIDVQD